MATLSEITKLDPELLHEKFELEPRNRYDPKHSDNLEFLSPLVLLEDLKLREGGFQDRGAKEVLSRVAKKICESKDPSLLQIPEIPYLHMGYGKKSENKKDQMALDKEEAEVWMGFLDLSRFSRERIPDEESTLSEGEIAMEIDFPTPRDTQALDTEGLELEDTQAADPEGLEADAEELVRPNDSGLQIPLKGSYILLFSILLIFFDKKKKQKTSASSTDEEAKIGANKISDFLLFWILPYLLNYTHKKVREIVKHHKEVNNFDFQAVVKKSTLDIIQDAMASCHVSAELREAIMTNYKDFYGTEQLEYKYNLLKSKDGAPVILVPKCYKVTEMPAKLEDIGSTWRELGNVKLLDEFMSKFVKNKAIQKDFLYSLPLLRHHQGVDYAIILPDEKTFKELIEQLENQSCDFFSAPQVVKKGGRYLSKVRIGLVTATEKHLAVSFSYIQGNDSRTTAAMFRAIGAQYVDHFTLVLLHGQCLNRFDMRCKLGSLYPVNCHRKVLFKGSIVRVEKKEKDFSEGRGQFSKVDFPATYKSWEQAVQNDLEEQNLKIVPKFEHDAPLTVAYSTASCEKKLSGNVAFGATYAKTEDLEDYNIRAVNLNGALLSKIAKCGRKDNIAVVLAIKDVCGKVRDSLARLPEAIVKIVANFARAAVVGGLPKVYPSETDEEDRDEIECESSEEDDDDQPAVMSAGAASSSGERGITASNSSSETPSRCTVKTGSPSSKELSELAYHIGRPWKILGRLLNVDDSKLDGIDDEHRQLTEKAYRMLLSWKQGNADAATYQVLYENLSNKQVGHSDLAKKYCTL